MPQTDYSSNYLLYNAEVTKNLVVAVVIDGVAPILTSSKIYERIRYGDPDLHYGDDGIVYGGVREIADSKNILDLTGGSLTVSQRLEPEQGRGAISTLSMSFIDLNQYMTQLISPGVIIPDILGAKTTVYLGYQEIGFPEDYTVIFRGRVSSYEAESGRVTLQFSDPNVIRRQEIFYIPKTTLSAPITSGSTTIPVVSNADFFQQIVGPNGSYDPGIKTYLTIGEEIIEYPASGYGSNQFTGCTRGARGTTPAAAIAGDEVSATIEITDNCIDMALKLMLSGWNGPYLSNIDIQSFVYTADPIVGAANTGLIQLENGKDADRDYGIAVGDYLTITGAAATGNNVTARVLQLVNLENSPNQAIITDATFSLETPSSAVFSVRSQYDTYPVGCGIKLPATEVDVLRHQEIKATFLSSTENSLRFYIDATESSCKTFIESQIYLPTASYSITRFGRLSMQLTHAPIADQRLQFFDGTNVLDPQNIKPSRGVNNRKFFNQINWTYDYNDAGNPATTLKSLDTDSLNIIGLSTVLPIDAKGIRSEFGSQTSIDRRTNYFLSRYKNGAVLITIKVNWAVGCLIEAGDVVAIKDDGVLQISNLVTGSRNLGTQLFEVINRSLDIKNGSVSLQLVSGLGADATDRYATIAPSSVLRTGSNVNELFIGDSFGALYPSQEYRKWQDYTGNRIMVHSEDWSVSATAELVSLNQANPNILNVTGLGVAPSAGMILDLDYYSESADPLDQETVKVVHAFFSPRVTIESGVSSSSFVVAASSIGKFQEGFPIAVHNASFSVSAPERTVASVDVGTNTVTASSSLGFTPASGYFVDLLGFPDGSPSYRLI